jgi:hypothetical protein
MSKFALVTLCLIALLSGLGWAVLSQQPLLVTAAVVAISLSLAGLSWQLGE